MQDQVSKPPLSARRPLLFAFLVGVIASGLLCLITLVVGFILLRVETAGHTFTWAVGYFFPSILYLLGYLSGRLLRRRTGRSRATLKALLATPSWYSLFWVLYWMNVDGVAGFRDVLQYVIVGAIYFVPAWLTTLLGCRGLRSKVVPDDRDCTRCGYDLTGNVSGICPEYRTAIVHRRAVSARSAGRRLSIGDMISYINLLGILILALGGAIACGIQWAFGDETGPIQLFVSSLLVVALDLGYRTKTRQSLWLGWEGGSLFWLPVWFYGAFFWGASVAQLVKQLFASA